MINLLFLSWASFCGPCKKAFPVVDSLKRAFPNIQFVGLTYKEDVKKSVNALKKAPHSFQIAKYSKELFDQLDNKALPNFIVLKTNGDFEEHGKDLVKNYRTYVENQGTSWKEFKKKSQEVRWKHHNEYLFAELSNILQEL